MIRYRPERAFPLYPFEPGAHPHPTREPQGHSYGAPEESIETALAWGVDLYNHAYFWEAHEAWEPLWRAAPSKSPEASAIQGLIQCAAACVKARAGEIEAATRIGARAVAHLRRTVDESSALSEMDLREFTDRFAQWIAGTELRVDERPPIVLESVRGVRKSV